MKTVREHICLDLIENRIEVKEKISDNLYTISSVIGDRYICSLSIDGKGIIKKGVLDTVTGKKYMMEKKTEINKKIVLEVFERWKLSVFHFRKAWLSEIYGKVYENFTLREGYSGGKDIMMGRNIVILKLSSIDGKVKIPVKIEMSWTGKDRIRIYLESVGEFRKSFEVLDKDVMVQKIVDEAYLLVSELL